MTQLFHAIISSRLRERGRGQENLEEIEEAKEPLVKDAKDNARPELKVLIKDRHMVM